MKHKKIFFGLLLLIACFLASCMGTSYKVVFWSEGTEYDSVDVKKGDKVEEPMPPSKDGFIGWKIEDIEDELFDFNTPINKDLNLIACFDSEGSEQTFKVTFLDYDDVVLKEEIVKSGDDATPPEDPVRSGYVFTEWEGSYQRIRKDTTIKAIYVPAKHKFQIKYILNGGAWGYVSKQDYTKAFLNDFYEFIGPAEDLHEFIYGKSDDKYSGTWQNYVKGAKNKLIKGNPDDVCPDYFFNNETWHAKWQDLLDYMDHLKIKIDGDDFCRYIANDESVTSYGIDFYRYPETKFPVKEEFTFGDCSHLPKPLSSTFAGWYLNGNCIGEKIERVPDGYSKNLVLYASWNHDVKYEIILDAEGKILPPIICGYNEEIILPVLESSEGRYFYWWQYNGSTVKSPYKFKSSASITLTAKYSSKSYVPEELRYRNVLVTHRGGKAVMIPNIYRQPERQLRAVWTSSLVDDFYPSDNKAKLQENLNEVLATLEKYNLNCIIFHIRTMNNAFYRTELAPMEHYGLTDWDYLPWFINECHKRGIEFHAWLNPYRIRSAGYPQGTTPEDVSKKYASYPLNPASRSINILMTGVKGDGAILDPAREEVQDYIVKVCLEVMEKYDVDAIHFDDYFYAQLPGGGILDQQDQAEYEAYCDAYNTSKTSKRDKEDWRRHNVNSLIHKLSDAMRSFNRENGRKVQLGISPSGIWRNGNGSRDSGSNTAGWQHYGDYLYSDTKYWIDMEWIDYIMPQSYWAFTHPVAGYADVMDWWNLAVEGKAVNLYSGIGLYMGASPGRNYSWGREPYEVCNQVLYTTGLENVSGVSFFSYKHLEMFLNDGYIPKNGMLRLKDEYFINYVKPPEMKYHD